MENIYCRRNQKTCMCRLPFTETESDHNTYNKVKVNNKCHMTTSTDYELKAFTILVWGFSIYSC